MPDTAFILAAGLGTRLRPLTNFIPKPLVQVGGETLLERHLKNCVTSGFKRVIVNHAHLGEQIDAHCKSFIEEYQPDFELILSPEPEGGLETAGGIIHALEHIDNKPFTLINADIYSDFNLSKLKDIQLERSHAHLVLCPTPEYKDKDDFYLAQKPGALKVVNSSEPGLKGYTFTGISVIDPKLVEGVDAGKLSLTPLLRNAADDGLVRGEVYEGVWHDVGTAERLKVLRATVNTLGI